LSETGNLRGVSRVALTLALVAIVAVAGVAAIFVTMGPIGASTTTAHTSTMTTGPSSNIDIALSPALPLIAPGQTQNYTSIRIGGTALNGTIVLAVSAPPGLTLVPETTSVSLSSNAQSIPLVLKAAPSLPTGKYQVTITSRSAVVLAGSETFSVEVVPMLVVLHALAFHPQNVTVPKGTAVTWINLDSNIGCCDPGYHNVVFLSGANGSSPQLKQLDSWSFKFDATGEANYFCSIHPYMKGQVTVTG
jgi:plastocyanin